MNRIADIRAERQGGLQEDVEWIWGVDRPRKAARGVVTRSYNSRPKAQAAIMNGAPLYYKPSTMRRRIEEENSGIEIMGARWVLKKTRGEDRWPPRYLHKIKGGVVSLKMGRKYFRAERYDWERGVFFRDFVSLASLMILDDGANLYLLPAHGVMILYLSFHKCGC